MHSGEDALTTLPILPTSEVGCEHPKENRMETTSHGEENDGSGDNWRLLFEIQNSNMKALIEALSKPQRSAQIVALPEFDPDKTDADARSWCATADLCFADNPIEGGQLIVAISKALKGTASAWLASVSFPGMKWTEFKELFIARFVSTETPAGTLIKLSTDKPKEGETLAAYGSRVMSSLFNRWKNLAVEQIVVATTVAHTFHSSTRDCADWHLRQT